MNDNLHEYVHKQIDRKRATATEWQNEIVTELSNESGELSAAANAHSSNANKIRHWTPKATSRIERANWVWIRHHTIWNHMR